MGTRDTGAGPDGGADLRASSEDLTKLADDLDDTQDHLDRQVRRMDSIVDRIEKGWRGPAGTAYRGFHRAAAEDAVRIRDVLRHLERAVRLSRDGFTQDELDVLQQMRSVRVDIDSEVDRLSTAHPDARGGEAPGRQRSSLDSF
ncbi:WXG100 family type VII secretion target [Streptomyces sp. S07_1.15]|uniref:WXG100 family type VII secretion target n=1 Tax=Streptomyces sp. S07_1.15 TaxID=2873925 RepID=UPI001D14ED60|nr:WXG100 family type VII secretion target [Streptomyces sp. S07_1.15]MCC3650629.1 WXG100 family type VII secretion target [Streptomyces sp. S07_1.15]